MRILDIGTMVRAADGREGPVVYHNLDGQGVRLGRGPLSEDEVAMLLRTTPVFSGTDDDGFPEELKPNAMLREQWPGATMECLGDDWEVVK